MFTRHRRAARLCYESWMPKRRDVPRFFFPQLRNADSKSRFGLYTHADIDPTP
jgi:hypothetical protein